MKREGLKLLNLSMILSILLYFGMGYLKNNFGTMVGQSGSGDEGEDGDSGGEIDL